MAILKIMTMKRGRLKRQLPHTSWTILVHILRCSHICRDSEAALPLFHKQSIDDEPHFCGPEDCQHDSDVDTLFDQHIRSPSPAATPDDQISSVSDIPLTRGILDHHGGQSDVSRNSGSFLNDGTISTRESSS